MNSQDDSRRSDIGWRCAADVMRREVVCVREADTIDEVERVIADAGVSGVPVLDAEDRVVGVVSVSDLVRRRADHDDETIMPLDSVDDDGNDIAIEGGRPAGSALCACDVMTPGAETVAPDANLREVARRMVDSGIHRVLVVKDDRLEGIISTFDILRALAE